MPGFNGPGWPELNIDRDIVDGLVEQMAAFRARRRAACGAASRSEFQLQDRGLYPAGAGAGAVRADLAGDRQLRPGGAGDDPALSRTRIASLELLYGRRQFRPFFEQQSVDVAIIDVAWNGILESMKIAAMADAYEVNVAPHNFNGHMGSLMSAHMCAAIPNFRVMEIDIEDVPWKDDLVTRCR